MSRDVEIIEKIERKGVFYVIELIDERGLGGVNRREVIVKEGDLMRIRVAVKGKSNVLKAHNPNRYKTPIMEWKVLSPSYVSRRTLE
ncbi:hypothetical protein ACT7DJ_28055 [Bacillus cereus]